MTVFDKKTGKVHSLAMAGAAPKASEGRGDDARDAQRGHQRRRSCPAISAAISMLERFGTMSLADVLAPAIEYAEKGYPIDPSLARRSIARAANLSKHPTTAKVFLPNGRPPEAGELLKNPDLAATIKKVVDAEQAALKQKAKSRAQAIQAGVRSLLQGRHRAGVRSLLQGQRRRADRRGPRRLQPQWQEPVHTTYRGYDIYSNPATSRGGIELVMQLNLRRRLRPGEVGREQPRGAAPDDRGDQGRQDRHLQVRRRSEVHADARSPGCCRRATRRRGAS